MGDWHNQLGLIELVLFEGIVLLIAGHQLWSVRKSLRETREKNLKEAQNRQSEQKDHTPPS
jgi:hypothetical protein